MSWREVTLDQLIDLHDHRRIPLSGVEREKRQGGYRYFGAQGVIDHIDAFIFDGAYVLVAEDGENLRSRKQPIAQIVSGQFWVNNHAHIVTGKKGVSNNKFVCAVLNWLDLGPYITGAAQPKLSQGSLKNIRLLAPDAVTQAQIATVLSEYDNLISTNQRRIALLEEAARRLYREWFVHFRFLGHETVKLVEGLPQGWNKKPLSSVADVNARSIGSRGRPDSILYIDISCVSQGQVNEVVPYAFEDAPGRARRRVSHGDVIWSSVRPNRRAYALILDPDKSLVASTGFAVLSATGVPFSYLFCATTTDEFVGHLEQNATGAAYPAVTGKVFEGAEILVPDTETLMAFDSFILPCLEQAETLKKHNKALAQARDALLPKLMSGQLDVSMISIEEAA